MTDGFGKPVEDTQNSMTAGRNGPALAQDVQVIEKRWNGLTMKP